MQKSKEQELKEIYKEEGISSLANELNFNMPWEDYNSLKGVGSRQKAGILVKEWFPETDFKPRPLKDFVNIVKEKFPEVKYYSSVRTIKFGSNVFHSEDILYIASAYDAHKEEFGLKDYCIKRSGKEVRCLIFY